MTDLDGIAVRGQASYALGSSDLEHERLMVQARLLRPWTEHFLRAGGLRPGMSVLDLGSGIGDVTLLAAEIVGPEIDLARSLNLRRRQARARILAMTTLDDDRIE